MVMRPLLFVRAEEALHHRVVPAVSSAAHAALDVVLLQQTLIGFARALTSAVGMMHEMLGRSSPAQGIRERVFDEFSSHVRRH